MLSSSTDFRALARYSVTGEVEMLPASRLREISSGLFFIVYGVVARPLTLLENSMSYLLCTLISYIAGEIASEWLGLGLVWSFVVSAVAFAGVKICLVKWAEA